MFLVSSYNQSYFIKELMMKVASAKPKKEKPDENTMLVKTISEIVTILISKYEKK